jgi:hypothetical protein
LVFPDILAIVQIQKWKLKPEAIFREDFGMPFLLTIQYLKRNSYIFLQVFEALVVQSGFVFALIAITMTHHSDHIKPNIGRCKTALKPPISVYSAFS